MATKKKYDIVVKVGEYEKDGDTKNRYQNVGVVLQGDNGPFILLNRTFNPAGVPETDEDHMVLLSLFEDDDEGSSKKKKKKKKSKKKKQREEDYEDDEDEDEDLDDEIPF